MLESTSKIYIDDVQYVVLIYKKKVKNLRISFNGVLFKVTRPIYSSKKTLNDFIDTNAKSLIKRYKKRNDSYLDGVYILGNKAEQSNVIFLDQLYHFNSIDELYLKIKKPFLTYLKKRCYEIEEEMNIPHIYKIRLGKYKTILGSNSKKSNTITLNIKLIHYSLASIDAIIYHEYAHYFEMNHQKSFYDVLYKYCPNYDILLKEIRKIRT